MTAPAEVSPAIVVEFAPGTRVVREPPHTAQLPIVGNGPPGTFVRFPGGAVVPLPTDLIVRFADDGGSAVVAFGGMRFDGIEDGELVFRRVHDLWPAERLSPERGRRMTLGPSMVAAVFVADRLAWPEPS